MTKRTLRPRGEHQPFKRSGGRTVHRRDGQFQPANRGGSAPGRRLTHMQRVESELPADPRVFPHHPLHLVQGDLHALAVQQALGQVKGTFRRVLVCFHPNPEFPVLHHRGGHRNQHRHRGDDHRREHQKQGRQKQQHRPVEGRHLLPQFCHDFPGHPLKGQQTPDGEPNFRQVILGEPHLQQRGGVQRSNEVGGVGVARLVVPPGIPLPCPVQIEANGCAGRGHRPKAKRG